MRQQRSKIEGFSLDDVLALDAARIAEYGFVIIGVTGSPDSDDGNVWAYTVGLGDTADHPELVVAGPSVEIAGSLLACVADSVLAGERYAVGDKIRVDRGDARVGAVHEIQYELDTFNMWKNLRAFGAVRTEALDVLQVVVPPTYFCSCHRDCQPLLDDSNVRVDAGRRRPNRAERRQHRGHRRAG